MEEKQGELLRKWTEAKESSAYWKDREAALRKEVFSTFFEEPKEGVNKLELEGGWTLKADYKYNRTVDKAALPAVLEQLDKGITDRLIKYKPELSITEYKRLTEDQRVILAEAITEKPGSPSITIIPPKDT